MEITPNSAVVHPLEVTKHMIPAQKRCVRHAVDFTMPSLGIVDQLLADDSVNDILINGTHSIYVDRNGQLVDSGLHFFTHDEVWNIAETILNAVNQTWEHDRLMVDTRLPDGSRVNIVGPPIAVDGVSISIRKFPSQHVTLDTMVERGQLSTPVANFLKECVQRKLNILISGGTSSGKTTLLNGLSAAIPHSERIVTIEDSAELRLQQPHVVRLESKPARIGEAGEASVGEVSMRDLVKNSLRMRPNRIIIGEVRGGEAFDMVQAMNTGHEGSMATLHANAPREALGRLETMIMIGMPNIASKAIRQQISTTFQLVLQIARTSEGLRHISNISEVCGMEGEVIIMQELVSYKVNPKTGVGEHRWTGGAPRHRVVMDAAHSSGMLPKGV